VGETTLRDIGRLRGEIVAWRRERYDRAPLPERLWAQAVEVARCVGVNQARHALGLSYQGLQAHVEQASAAPEFVEVSGAEVLAAGSRTASGTSIEISGRDVYVVVRLGGGDALDLSSLVTMVRGRS
jgi:hypothetical protein